MITLPGSAGFISVASTPLIANIIRGPPTATLALTGNAPTIFQGALISPPAGQLTATGFAPNQGVSYLITPSVGSLSVSGAVPTIITGAGFLITPPSGSLAASGIASSLKFEFFITPPAGSLTATGIASGLSKSIAPTKGDFALTGYAPTVTAAAGFIISPPVGSLTVTGTTSSLRQDVIFAPSVGQLNAAGTASGSSKSLTPSVGSMSATGSAPVSGVGVLFTTTLGGATLTGIAPSLLIASVGRPPLGSVGVTGYAPLIQIATTVPRGSVAIVSNAPSVIRSGVQNRRTQLGPRFIPQKVYKINGFEGKAGNITATTQRGPIAITGFAPSVAQGQVFYPPVADGRSWRYLMDGAGNYIVDGSGNYVGVYVEVPGLAFSTFVPSVQQSILGDRTITPPKGSLSITGIGSSAVINFIGKKKTQQSARFIPGRRYGNFGGKSGVNIAITPPCGGAVKVYYLVDENGNVLVDQNGNPIIVTEPQPNTTAIFSGFPPVVQKSSFTGFTISPPRGSLSIASTPSAAVVNRAITPPKGNIAATGLAPRVVTDFRITPPAGSLSITGNTPKADRSYFITPPRGTLTATGTAPNVFIGAPSFNFPVGRAQLAITGFVPTVAIGTTCTRGDLSLTGFAPTVSTSINFVPPTGLLFIVPQFPIPARSEMVFTQSGSLSATGNAPSLLAPNTLIPPAGTLGLTSAPPTVITARLITPPKGDLTLTGTTQAVVRNFIVQPQAGSLTVAGNPPNAGQSYAITPPTGILQATGNTPTIFAVSGEAIGVPRGSLDITGYPPSTDTGAVCGQGQLSITGFAPLIATAPIFITPPTGALSATGRPPVLSFGAPVVRDAGSLSISSDPPIIQVGPANTPVAGLGVFTGYAPAIVVPTVIHVPAGSLDFAEFIALTKQPDVILIELRGKAVLDFTMTGRLIKGEELSGQAVEVVIVKRHE